MSKGKLPGKMIDDWGQQASNTTQQDTRMTSTEWTLSWDSQIAALELFKGLSDSVQG